MARCPPAGIDMNSTHERAEPWIALHDLVRSAIDRHLEELLPVPLIRD